MVIAMNKFKHLCLIMLMSIATFTNIYATTANHPAALAVKNAMEDDNYQLIIALVQGMHDGDGAHHNSFCTHKLNTIKGLGIHHICDVFYLDLIQRNTTYCIYPFSFFSYELLRNNYLIKNALFLWLRHI